MRKAIAMVMMMAFCTGCYTMKYNAPVGTPVSTLSETEPAAVTKSVKVWYALWGLVPITDNSSQRIIDDYKLKKARVTTQFKFEDVLIGIFTGVASIVPATMTVEGTQ